MPGASSFRIAFVLAALALGAASCSEYFTDPWEWGRVDVTVTFQTGEPAPGVDLTFFSGTRVLDRAFTDDEGRHTFGFGPWGPLGVAVTTPRFQPGYQVQTFRMEEGGHRELSFTVVHCVGDLLVLVEDEEGAPVPGAQLTLYTWQEVVQVADVDEFGAFRFVGLDCDNYGVRIAPPPGFTVEEGPGSSWIDGLIVQDGEELVATFILSAT